MSAPNNLYDPQAFLTSITERVGAIGSRPLMGLDPGTKTIGVALSDTRWTMASPVKTIRRTKLAHDLETLAALAASEAVCGIVIGMPYNMDGSPGPRAQSVRAFRRSLAERIDLPVLFWDERLSTHEAAEALTVRTGQLSRAQATIDAAAAAHILTECLRALANLTNR